MLCLGLALALGTGCASTGDHGPDQVAAGPIHDPQGHARSLALSAPIVRKQRRAYARQGVTPSYVNRVNRGPVVAFGIKSPTLRRAQTRTYDQLHTTANGNVHDHFNRTTYRSRSVQTVE